MHRRLAMNAVAFCQPFVPPEWIAAHGLRPLWLRPAGTSASARRGSCPVADAVVETVERELPAAAVVLTTACDQMRCAAAALEQTGRTPVFLMHVPHTWRTAQAREYYCAELRRLGRFLAERGGTPPDDGELLRVMVQYDDARENLLRRRPEMSAVAFAEAAAWVRGDLHDACHWLRQCAGWHDPERSEGRGCTENHALHCVQGRAAHAETSPDYMTLAKPVALNSIPFALIGGPLLSSDATVLEALEKAGGRVVLDAAETGERTLPAPLDRERAAADPFDELARIYFDAIPDVFQRPNDRLYDWLRPRLIDRGVRGLIVRRHVWCDLWHAELPRLRQETGLPLLDWDADGGDRGSSAVAVGRMEAFLEMLR